MILLNDRLENERLEPTLSTGYLPLLPTMSFSAKLCLKGQSHEIFRVFLQQSSIDLNQERRR